MALIYVVEDDVNIQEIEMFALKNSGYRVEGFGNAKDFFAKLSEKTPDLILLDVMLPDLDGLSILKKVRIVPDTKKIPVIFVSAKTSEMDKVKGLDMGADDYLAKPFYPEELIARIRERFTSQLSDTVEEETYHFGQSVFNYSTNEIRTGNNKVLITSRQAEILRLLAKNLNLSVDRDLLLNTVWSSASYANSLALNVQITYLRKALRNDSSVKIESLMKKGYVLKDK